ncbi:MAG: hypothetical protein J7L07_03120 [Candidatus Odinarchaeota archaeon]|nr:hypothetical protein [Candidatus Odinarchaeota archaeon]
MTLHIVYNHRCPRCGACYIPYDKDVPCPNCGHTEEERFDYITRAVASLKFNLETFGSYMPRAWCVRSLGDHILHILFWIFEKFRKQKKQKDFGKFAEKLLSKMEWREQKYLEKHIYSIALRVYEELQRRRKQSAAYIWFKLRPNFLRKLQIRLKTK